MHLGGHIKNKTIFAGMCQSHGFDSTCVSNIDFLEMKKYIYNKYYRFEKFEINCNTLQVNRGKLLVLKSSSVNSLSSSIALGPTTLIAEYNEVMSLIKTLPSSGKCSLSHFIFLVCCVTGDIIMKLFKRLKFQNKNIWFINEYV